jgi:hypothetical protein
MGAGISRDNERLRQGGREEGLEGWGGVRYLYDVKEARMARID